MFEITDTTLFGQEPEEKLMEEEAWNTRALRQYSSIQLNRDNDVPAWGQIRLHPKQNNRCIKSEGLETPLILGECDNLFEPPENSTQPIVYDEFKYLRDFTIQIWETNFCLKVDGEWNNLVIATICDQHSARWA